MTGKRPVRRADIGPAKQLWLPLQVKGELFALETASGFPARSRQLMEYAVERGNLRTALQNVMRNKGGPGIDGMTVTELPDYLKTEWDVTFSESSYGFRPKRSAHQAIQQSQRYLKQGYRWVVDMDLEKFLITFPTKSWLPCWRNGSMIVHFCG